MASARARALVYETCCLRTTAVNGVLTFNKTMSTGIGTVIQREEMGVQGHISARVLDGSAGMYSL